MVICRFFLSSKVRVFFEALIINTPWWHWIVVIAHVVFSAKSWLQCSWKIHSSSFKLRRTKEPVKIWGVRGARENFLRFYKMPCKSVFLLPIKYIEKLKSLWQLKIGGGGEVKWYYYAMKGSISWGGGPSTIFWNPFHHPPSTLPPNKSSLSRPKFNGKLSHWGGTGSH